MSQQASFFSEDSSTYAKFQQYVVSCKMLHILLTFHVSNQLSVWFTYPAECWAGVIFYFRVSRELLHDSVYVSGLVDELQN